MINFQSLPEKTISEVLELEEDMRKLPECMFQLAYPKPVKENFAELLVEDIK